MREIRGRKAYGYAVTEPAMAVRPSHPPAAVLRVVNPLMCWLLDDLYVLTGAGWRLNFRGGADADRRYHLAAIRFVPTG
jgi:hypothetical protein